MSLALIVGLVLSGNDDTEKFKAKYFKIVDTKAGKVEGKIIKVLKDDGQAEIVYRFRNIPYAEPPTEDLRWKPPQRAKRWNKTLAYSDDEIWCKQPSVGVEDCLILTIRQPASANATHPYPVLFWIHGGSFLYGSSDWYYPDEQCSASLGMVTVSINYRLNTFGFLSLEEIWSTVTSDEPKEQSYGNFGVMDMILALEWVKDNIRSFGGDPNRVTILGESAGGAAVFSLVTSPMTSALFNKAIAASGYPVSLESSYMKANNLYGGQFKRDLNCTQGNANEIQKCLKGKTDEQIVDNIPFINQNTNVSDWKFPYNVTVHDYMRVIDNITITDPLTHFTKYNKEGRLKLLIGNTAHELGPQEEAETQDGMETYLKPRIDSFDPTQKAFARLMKLYREKRPLDKTSPQNITSQSIYQSMAADVALSCQTNNIVQGLRKLSNLDVYRYVVSQPLSKNFNTSSQFEPSAYHGIDTDALFGITYYYKDYDITNKDKALILNFRKMVKEFVYDEDQFDDSYSHKTIEFWDEKIVVWDKPYHDEECKVLEEYGFLKRSWGQVGA